MNTFKKSFFGAAVGTMIEYYDYALFLIFLPILAPLFFPASSLYASMEKVYLFFLVTMLFRPFGGLFFGYIGDTHGRRKALLGSMYGIAFATVIIGITPPVTLWGVAATLIVCAAKSIQIFCFGGEYNGAGIYVVEHAQNRAESFYGCLVSAITLLGSLIASILGIIFTLPFMPTWSWRIAFVLGGLIGVFAIFYRKNLAEPPQFKPAESQQLKLSTMLKKFPSELLAGVFVGGFATIPITTVLTFINPLLIAAEHLNYLELMIMQTCLITIEIMSLILFGWIADKYTPNKVMIIGCWTMIILAFPLLTVVNSSSIIWTCIALISLGVINAMFLAPSNAYLKNIFPMQYRYRAISLSFGLGMSLFGGLTPIVENYFYKQMGHQFSAISIWLILCAVGTYLAIRKCDQNQVVVLEADAYGC